MSDDFTKLIKQIEREAREAGPDAVAHLQTLRDKAQIQVEEIKVLRTIQAIAGQNHLLPERRLEEIVAVTNAALKEIGK